MFKNDLTEKEYGIKARCATTENTQDSSILEIIHQVIANLVRTFELQNNYLDEDDPWSGILAATDFAVRSTYHTTLQAMPGHMVFGCDMILNTPFRENWGAIRLRKNKIIDKINQLENKDCKPHIYIIRNKLLVQNKNSKKYEEPYVGPYSMTEVWTNGNVTTCRGTVQYCIRIRCIKPYHE